MQEESCTSISIFGKINSVDQLLLQHARYNNTLFRRYLPIYDFSEVLLHTIRTSVATNLPAKYGKVLDVACGTGTQLVALAKKGYQVTGIDLSPDMLSKAKGKLQRYPNASLLCGDATHMPFQDNAFDISLITFSLHDMPEEIAIGVLMEMKRVTKKGGDIVVVDYVTNSQQTIPFLTHKVARMWESKYYPYFTKKGLRHFVVKANVVPIYSKIYFHGIAEQLICKNI